MKLQLTLTRLLCLVALVAVLLAGLLRPSHVFAGIAVGLTVTMLLVAALKLWFPKRNEDRPIWAGFVLFGTCAFGSAFFTDYGTHDSTREDILNIGYHLLGREPHRWRTMPAGPAKDAAMEEEMVFRHAWPRAAKCSAVLLVALFGAVMARVAVYKNGC